MRNELVAALTLTLLLSFVAAARGGGWGDEVPVTQDPALQFVSDIAAAPGDVLHVLWPDWTDFEDTKVTLTTSHDLGATWSEPATLFDGTAYDQVDIHADAAGVHLVIVEFLEDEEEFKHAYYTGSADGGVTFSRPVRIGDRDNVESIRFFSAPGRLFLYAKNYVKDLDFDYLYVSDDGGATWTEKSFLSSTPVANPGFTIRGDRIHAVFGGSLGSPEIRHAVSDDDGDTWSTPVAVSGGAARHSQLPQVAVDDVGVVHVVWEDDRDGDFQVLYARSTDGGVSFGPDEQLNDTPYGARAQIMASDGGLDVVWCQYHGDDGWPSTWGSFDYGVIWHRASTDGGVTWSDELRVSQNELVPPIDLPSLGANVVELAPTSAGFAALWQDKRDGNIDLYVRNRVASAPCPADLDGSGDVGFTDLLGVLAQWGPCPGCPADLDGDGAVGFTDLLTVLASWGPCAG